MSNFPSISIILSNYNCEKYVWKTIESVIAQTFTDWELIAVDDGSVDNSREVITRYANEDKRIRPFFLEENVGMCTAFNYAIEQAKGKYLARIDADDFWEPDKLMKQYQYMEAHPCCGVSFTWVRVIDENEKEVPSHLCEYRDKVYNSYNRTQAQWLRTFFVEGCKVCHPTAVIRREALERVGGKYNYIYKQVQDLDLWIRIAKHYEIYVLPEKLINYRWFLSDTPNASASNSGTLTRGLFEIYRIFSQFNQDISDELFCKAFADDMFNKNAKTHEEIACERAFIMYHKSYLQNTGRCIGLSMLDELMNNDKTRKILKELYNFTAKTYAEWTSYPLFYDSVGFNSSQISSKDKMSLKNKMKIWLQRYPKLFDFSKKCYKLITGK
jgi:glycosyltransferase involved in cell wall biosynthesis